PLTMENHEAQDRQEREGPLRRRDATLGGAAAGLRRRGPVPVGARFALAAVQDDPGAAGLLLPQLQELVEGCLVTGQDDHGFAFHGDHPPIKSSTYESTASPSSVPKESAGNRDR